ncbi:hypothetical protein P168DRAFT_148654 [Aspergillus campestris IBT 28561]|uniref:Helicase ATP-binding domain-containing protein n=1 Tax=Aspergillus campestris (strain IBT 28561) TaxID=1392248 RepID=A0A2I1D5Z4_ASPC2|nr:uncharacterized protein P168DRAFT_148654 [Aspergillus campestris IBT 28561]PKY05296.1 hypothetical protein P168DRAFT_148654 [Aspergillus campestris IBT 28561]
MPPNNKKKKKPAANPARGFATVSIPSKPKSTPTESTAPTSTAESKSVSESDRPTPAEATQSVAEKKPEDHSLQNYSPEELEKHLEDAELQILVEKYASKCKNDAARQVTKVETERRIFRQQAVPLNLLEWLPADIVSSVLRLAEMEESELSPGSGRDSNATKKPVSEEELYMRLWSLRATLLRLGFPQEKVEEALKHLLQYYSNNFISTNREMVCNFDEALDWLAMHCEPRELPSYTQTNSQSRSDADRNISWIADREQENTSAPKPSQNSGKPPKPKDDVKLPLPSDPYESDVSLDPDTLLPKYLELQTRLYNLRPEVFDKPKKGKKGASGSLGAGADGPQIASIQRQIASILNDVLFDRAEAEYRWQEKLDDLRKEASFLRRSAPEAKNTPKETETNEQKEEKAIEPGNASPAAEDNEAAGDLLGDMFQGEEEPVLELGVITEELNNAAVTSRDFGKWTGLSPRRVLEETCKARDTGCKIIYKDFSSSSHLNRMAVEVRWSKPQDLPFPFVWDTTTVNSNSYATFVSMDSIATPTSQQAESFVSTLALFVLFPQSSKEGKAYLRIPAVWRDLWTEFSTAKKTQEDEADKATIRTLKGLVQENHGALEDDIVLAANFRKRNGTPRKGQSPVRATSKENAGFDPLLKKIWDDKASTHSFQLMMQGRMNLPIWSFKDEIVHMLDTHHALIICSETGSGKSTQIPSFILEHEMQQGRPCKIYVTEPRRISAISLARRVSEELGESKNDVGTARSFIGFAVRLESKVSQSTRLVYAYVFLCPFPNALD